MPDGNPRGVRDETKETMRRWLSIASVVFLAVVLFAYRNEVVGGLAYSFSYLTWSLNLFGSVIPPQGVWIGLLILIVYIAVGSFYGKVSSVGKNQMEPGPVTGPVEAMAEWVEERGRGVYFKWRIAHLLARVHQSHFRNTSGRLLPAPKEVEAYLDAGLNSSYMDYPTPMLFKKYEPTILDIELEPVLDYLEDQMEIQR